VCNFHLQSVVRRHDELLTASIREAAVFHSSENDLRHNAADLPFAVITDPEKRLYVDFGVEASPRALFDPRAWLPIVRAVLYDVGEIIRGRRPVPPIQPEGGSLGLPADFKRKGKDEYPSVVVQTESIDKTLKAIEAGGGKVVTPKHSIGKWGFMADFADPEGNVFALWEKGKK
jgi:hypothetical protein